VSCYDLPGFDTGPRPDTYDDCGLRNRLDYALLSRSLQPTLREGHLFRKGLWGSRKTKPTGWDTCDEMTKPEHQASDHAALVCNLDL
jgi:hypothetical protein